MNWRDTVSPFLQVLYGSTVRPYSTYDFGRQQDPANISVIAPGKEVREKLPLLRERLPSGLVAFIGTNEWYGDEKHNGVEVVVAQCESQFDILRISRARDGLLDHLKRYDDAYGIDIYQASTDTVAFMLMTTPDDMPAFAEDLYRLCPDAVDKGSGSLDYFRENIAMTGVVHLWWD